MKETATPSTTDNREFVRQGYLRAYRFAWMMMVVLAFVGSMIAELALQNLVASIMLGALSLIGMIAQELYLLRVFKGVPQPFEERRSRPLWKVLSVLFVMLLWLLSDIVEGQWSVRSLVFAVVSGSGLAAFLWWHARFAAERGSAQEMIRS